MSKRNAKPVSRKEPTSRQERIAQICEAPEKKEELPVSPAPPLRDVPVPWRAPVASVPAPVPALEVPMEASAENAPSNQGETKNMEADLATAMEEVSETTPLPDGSILVQFVAAASGGKGKKNPRFGKNPDGTPAKKADKKEIVRKSEWGQYLFDFKQKHPDLCPLEATIEARKTYVPKSGKQKSFERIFTEVWKTKNPKWSQMTKEQRVAAIRADFVKAI